MMNNDDIQKAIDLSLEKLKTWIASEYGRMTKLAAELEVPKQRVSEVLKNKTERSLSSGWTNWRICDPLKSRRSEP
jgi:hypothetical protein